VSRTRVSTIDQHPQLQVDALTAAGCYRVFTETASGARTDRPTLEQLLDQLRPGDTLVVWNSTASAAPSGIWSTPSPD
jgi:DNA invertase Pin-like site-specific DNA recombinase